MVKLEFTFFVGYVNNKIWETDVADKCGYVPISRDLIESAKNIVYNKGKKIAIIDSKNKEIKLTDDDYLFRGNLVRIDPLFTTRPVQRWGPDIELHSETREGLTKLIKDLGFPKTKKM